MRARWGAAGADLANVLRRVAGSNSCRPNIEGIGARTVEKIFDETIAAKSRILKDQALFLVVARLRYVISGKY